MTGSGEMERKREHQHKVWMWNQISDSVMELFKEHPAVQASLERQEQLVAKGAVTPGQAADYLLKKFRGDS